MRCRRPVGTLNWLLSTTAIELGCVKGVVKSALIRQRPRRRRSFGARRPSAGSTSGPTNSRLRAPREAHAEDGFRELDRHRDEAVGPDPEQRPGPPDTMAVATPAMLPCQSKPQARHERLKRDSARPPAACSGTMVRAASGSAAPAHARTNGQEDPVRIRRIIRVRAWGDGRGPGPRRSRSLEHQLADDVGMRDSREHANTAIPNVR